MKPGLDLWTISTEVVAEVFEWIRLLIKSKQGGSGPSTENGGISMYEEWIMCVCGKRWQEKQNCQRYGIRNFLWVSLVTYLA